MTGPRGEQRTVERRLAELAAQYDLPAGADQRLMELLRLVRDSPHSLTAVRDPVEAVEVHVADSLGGLRLEELQRAAVIADLGSGAGFPGLVLALARPDARVALVESVGKKAEFLRETAERLGLANVEVVADRAESWTAGMGACDAVTARALAPLAVLLEYAAPLLRDGGALVAWKGRRDMDEEREGQAAADLLGMETPITTAVPGPREAQRHLYLSRKLRSTPAKFPRRPGMARKRPLGASSRA